MKIKFKSKLFQSLLDEANSRNISIATLVVEIVTEYFEKREDNNTN